MNLKSLELKTVVADRNPLAVGLIFNKREGRGAIMAELQGPGLSKIYLDNFQLRQDYPRLIFPGFVTAIELSNFDVSSSNLKSEHIHALLIDSTFG
jgi:hypothetical protein